MTRAKKQTNPLSNSVLQAIKNTEESLNILGEAYASAAYKRLSDIIITQELSLKELKNLYNDLT